MPGPKRLSRRKSGPPLLSEPTQLRARATVERIKDAMARLVAAQGYSAASTNAIAREAGISIGALYRYFPNRAAIAMALYEDDCQRLADKVNAELDTGRERTLAEGVAQLAIVMLDFMEGERPFLQQLIQEEPALRNLALDGDFERRVWSKSHAFLKLHLRDAPGMDEAAIKRKAFFVQHCSMGLMRRYVLERPAYISRTAFIAEFVALVLGFVGSAAGAVPPVKRSAAKR